MSLKEDLKAASKAHDKLIDYCAGLPKNTPANAKYLELNRKMNEALEKLPVGMRSRFALDIASLLK